MSERPFLYQSNLLVTSNPPLVSSEKIDPYNASIPVILRDVVKMRNELVLTGYVSTNQLLYTGFNEKTQAIEATTHGLVHSTYQPWDSSTNELKPFGNSSLDILRQGLENARELNRTHPGKYVFEIARRQVELADLEVLTSNIAKGQMADQIKITLSPFPDDADPETASEIGYFPHIKAAMLRVLDFDPESQLVRVTQISVDHSDVEIFSQLIKDLTGQECPESHPTAILGQQIYVPKNLGLNVVDLAQKYDTLLARKNGGTYFFGKETAQHPDYSSVAEATKVADKQIQPIIDSLVNLDLDLAVSLQKGQALTNIRQKIVEAILRSENGRPIVNTPQVAILRGALSGDFTLEAAEIIKHIELIDHYKLIVVVANDQKSRELFAETEAVNSVRARYYRDPRAVLATLRLASLNSKLQPEFYFCGGRLQSSLTGYVNIYELPTHQAIAVIKEGVRYLDCTCGLCGKKVKASIFNGKIHCPSPEEGGCGGSANYVC